MSPIEYSSLPRDSKRESEIAKWLRTQSEHDKFEFVWCLLRKNAGLGLPLVKVVQLRPVYLEVFLEHGFVYGDASTVRWWYESTVHGLGEKKVLELLAAHLENAPLIVEKMLYWFRPANEMVFQETKELRQKFQEKYPNFKSSRSTGIHATGT
jgi:hypothetical protein